MYKTVRNLTVFSLGLGISAVVGWLLLKESKRGKDVASVTIRSQSRASELDEIPQIVLPLEPIPAEEQSAAAAPEPTLTQPDDLTLINGIGPRYAEALHAIGITQYAQLAAQEPEELANKLAPYVTIRAQRIRDNDWIGQALNLAKNQI